MASYTSAASGNWDSSSTWTPAGVPGSGDTVTIANGHTVTVPTGYTAVVGTSPADDTGAVALQAANTASGTGVLVVAGTLRWQGPVRMGAATWTVAAGGTLTYDASGAATPASALYTWQTGQATLTGGTGQLALNGASGSRCTVQSVGNVQSGGFGNKATNWQGGGQIVATYTDFSNQGAATTSGNFINADLDAGASLSLDHCTVTSCAQVQATGPFNVSAGIAPTAVFRLKQTKITAPVNTTYSVQVSVSGATFTTGTRLISNCDIAGQVFVNCPDGSGNPSPNNFTFKNNIFRCRDLTTGAMSDVLTLNGGGAASWDQNLLAIITASTTTNQDPKAGGVGGTMTGSYCLRLPVPTTNGANMHPVYLDQRSGSVALSGWVFQQAVQDTAGDVLNLNKEATAARTIKVTGCVYLPNSIGNAPGSLLNNQSSVSQSQSVLTFDHNSVGGGVAVPDTTQVFGVGAEAGTTWPAGAVASIRSNLIWRAASGTASIANSANSATVASGAVTAADYNNAFHVTGSIYGNPSGQFASTPGAHDLSADPQFVDSSRSILTFDRGYLGDAAGTAWATGTAYAIGQVVGSSVAGWYAGQAQNWRCVAAHTSGSTTQPGSGASFTQYWEPAALASISADVLAGNTYSGGANSLIGELVGWTMAGFAPTNAALATAAHDGTTIGAVAYQSTADTGTGSDTLAGLAASGSGSVADPGTGSDTLGRATASGSGGVGDGGSGSATLGPASASGTGQVVDAGAGAATLGGPSASGLGDVGGAGVGSPTLGRATAAGSGGLADGGSGAPATGRVAASGTGAVADPGSGAASLGPLAASGAGSAPTPTVVVPPASAAWWPSLLRRRKGHASSDPGSGSDTLGPVAASGIGSASAVVVPPASAAWWPLLRLWRRRRNGPLPPDLVAAVAAWLRAWQGGAIAQALGETTQTRKIWDATAMGSPAPPYVDIGEPMGVRTFQSGGNFIWRGQVQLSVYANSLLQARQLCQSIASDGTTGVPGALDDPPLAWQSGRLMKFRLRDTQNLPTQTPGIGGAPSTYGRMLTFDAWFSGKMNGS